jgi:AcrR family transcriptional regulator
MLYLLSTAPRRHTRQKDRRFFVTSEKAHAGLVTVRPKSTHRKQRTADLQRARLEPVQDRSRRRNDEILDAAAQLLETVNIEDLSHSDIAALAGMSKASVHYHFPTIASVQLALGRRYDAECSAYLARIPLPGGDVSWQELMRHGAAHARDWFNARRPACETLLGPLMTRENRLAGIEYNTQIGATGLRGLRRRFEIPEQPHLEEVFAYNGEIIDLFWSRSYLTRGHIDDRALEESLRASLGYLRNFLPEFLPPRRKAALDEADDTAWAPPRSSSSAS